MNIPMCVRALRQCIILFSWPALFLGLTLPGRSMTVVPPTFDELVAESDQVIRVAVISTEARLETTPGGPVICTYVHCQVLRTLKGEKNSVLSLRIVGGQIGNAKLSVPGIPQFVPGERSVLFLQKNGKSLCPIVGAGHGRFLFAPDAAAGEERVLRDKHAPLTHTNEIVQPLHSPAVAADTRSAASRRALSLTQFEDLIASRIVAQSPRAK
jgi:hypothetical protein